MTSRLATIAARAGVSQATVSRVLNSKPGVATDTRNAVLAAVDVLGYDRPAALRVRTARLVGMIVPELTNPVFPALAQVIESALTSRGYTPVLCTSDPAGVSEPRYVGMLLDQGVSGIIFVSGRHADSTTSADLYRQVVERGVPAVFVNGPLEGVRAAFVSCDEAAAAHLAVGHLYDLGHRRIGLAHGPRRFSPVIRRRAGYLAAIRRRHLAVEPELLAETDFSIEGGRSAGMALLDAGATAVVCASDLMALGVIGAVRERGLGVPAEVSVIGYDDSPLMAYADPPLSTVRQPVTQLGLAAVQALLDQVNDLGPPPTELLFRPDLVVRGSTGPAAAVVRSHRSP